MNNISIFEKYASETDRFTLDFSEILVDGIFDSSSNSSNVSTLIGQQVLYFNESIASVTATMSVYSGTDASPSSMIPTSPVISGTGIVQFVTGGVAGVTYQLAIKVVTQSPFPTNPASQPQQYTNQTITKSVYIAVRPSAV